jgi:hypothetical protein
VHRGLDASGKSRAYRHHQEFFKIKNFLSPRRKTGRGFFQSDSPARVDVRWLQRRRFTYRSVQRFFLADRTARPRSVNGNNNSLFGLTAQLSWMPKPSSQLTARTPFYAVTNQSQQKV